MGPLAGATVLVTGSTGFIGRPLCRALIEAGAAVRGASREAGAHPVAGVDRVRIADPLDRDTVRSAVRGATAVVHLAARVHVMREQASDPPAEFRRANVDATRILADEAGASGVRQFLFASTVKAVGEATRAPWTEAVIPEPVDPYGVSKLEAEHRVRDAATRSGMSAAMLRLPLVYGAGVKGNMLRLFRLVDRGIPLPFGSIANRRSMLYVGNLTAAILALLERPPAGAEVYFVSDGRDLSLPQLIKLIGRALGRSALLLPVPTPLLRLLLPGAEGDRLLGSLTVDPSKLAAAVGYRPPYSIEDGLRMTAEWYRAGAR